MTHEIELIRYQKGLPHPWVGVPRKKRPRGTAVTLELQRAWYRSYKEELHKKKYHIFDKTPEGKRLRKLRKQLFLSNQNKLHIS